MPIYHKCVNNRFLNEKVIVLVDTFDKKALVGGQEPSPGIVKFRKVPLTTLIANSTHSLNAEKMHKYKWNNQFPNKVFLSVLSPASTKNVNQEGGELAGLGWAGKPDLTRF